MTASNGIRLSSVVMHHPARAAKIPELLRRSAPLAPRVIEDPDPSGPPSPLRTAKRAWAAIEPGATHHLVLQDDVRPAPGFAPQLLDVIGQRPRHAISLYVNWNTPQNAYHVRRSVAVGSPWAPLSPVEYTPTLGLVLPADLAAELADHLAQFPDVLRDDDEVVAVFLRQRGIPVVAAVPHLLEHGNDRSMAGNEAHGLRYATVFAGDCPPSAGHWRSPQDLEAALARRCGYHSPMEFTVELLRSTCFIRFSRPGSLEAAEHPFGWYWADWCSLIGVDAEDVVRGWAQYAGSTERGARAACAAAERLSPGAVLEFWAACHLLGADASATGRGTAGGRLPAADQAALLSRVVRSWLVSGLSPADGRALLGHHEEALVEAGLRAVAHGRAAGLAEPDRDVVADQRTRGAVACVVPV
ncbi:hypothetical protein OHT68_30140 [Streptomyces canus]|uniref:hypothetical protein n=1 Tax=Streptomyces canus TaxID=58343 RepID=UPI002E2CA09C|nr:hypothetical protein [Streptomyces canus]